MVNPDFYAYGTGALLAISYMVMGIGLTRIVSKAKQRGEIRLFEVFLCLLFLA